MAGKNMTFLPGEEPGPIAGGLEQQADVGALMRKHLGMSEMPMGNKVSRWFPWMRRVSETLSADVLRLMPQNTRDPSNFFNNSDKDVWIDEIRMQVTPSSWTQYIWNQTDVLIKLSIPDRREIISDWLPWACLQTSPESMLLGELDNFVFPFPSPYFLQRDSIFLMDYQFDANVFANDVGPAEYAFMAGLHGVGVRDREPIDIIMPVYGWDRDSPDATEYQTLAFDDNRSHTLRDAWITHLTFGAAIRSNASENLQVVMVRPQPPSGPKWHRDEFYRLTELTHQVGSDHAAQDFMIHRPKVPYVLHPGEGLLVELLYTLPSAAISSEVVVTMLGRQEG